MDDFKKDLILLNTIENIGCMRFKTLLDIFQTPGNILKAPLKALISVQGIGAQTAEAIKNAHSNCDIDRELELIDAFGIKIVTLYDDEYPENLKSIYDPPILLYLKGDYKKEDELSVAIVGSRRCTYYGLNMAEKMASELVEHGVTVISGLARGIDTAAHKGAVRNKGRTIAVLGNGLASIYPAENRALAEEISRNGVLMSEFAMQVRPYKQNFPRRNRLVSGLSRGVVVVEAAGRSGALITADFALEQGRDVFAVPGMAGRLSSGGPNSLIKQGAKLVESADDILEEFQAGPIKPPAQEVGTPLPQEGYDEDIFKILSDKPCDIDTIVERLNIENRQAKLRLLDMQIKGIVRQLPGKLYIRN